MNRAIIISAAVILIVLIGLVTVINYTSLSKNSDSKPFYVGVTFCGDNTQDAKLLIDKVKNYTNLFVLQSGPLMANTTAVTEIGDYTVANGLHFAASFGTSSPPQQAAWVGSAEQRWGNMFAGIYYGDEPGGNMLDANIILSENTNNVSNGISNVTVTSGNILKMAGGELEVGDTSYFPDGTISVQKRNDTSSSEPDPDNSSITICNTLSNTNLTTYEPNSSITVRETITSTTNKVYSVGWPSHFEVGSSYQVLRDNFYTMENGSDRIAQEETYQQVQSKNPIPDCDTAANLFINKTKEPVDNLRSQWNISKGNFPLFTSDYGLYWWDYQSGYDLVLAELGWNNSAAQEIGLVRGAANLQDKNWGTIITWTYTQPPYLTSGDEMYNQMLLSYECGAQYVIVFNYNATDINYPYGTLQSEHFQALQRFWNEVVQNPNVKHGGIKAEAALVLPKDFGWGMRNPADTIWGLWNTNSTSDQIWTQLQSKLAQYGSKLDIVYDDPAYPVAGKYGQIYFWNQTSK